MLLTSSPIQAFSQQSQGHVADAFRLALPQSAGAGLIGQKQVEIQGVNRLDLEPAAPAAARLVRAGLRS